MARTTSSPAALTALSGAGRMLRDVITASPSRFALAVYSLLILVFTALFSLPAASADGTVTPLADALFTANFQGRLIAMVLASAVLLLPAKSRPGVCPRVYHKLHTCLALDRPHFLPDKH